SLKIISTFSPAPGLHPSLGERVRPLSGDSEECTHVTQGQAFRYQGAGGLPALLRGFVRLGFRTASSLERDAQAPLEAHGELHVLDELGRSRWALANEEPESLSEPLPSLLDGSPLSEASRHARNLGD